MSHLCWGASMSCDSHSVTAELLLKTSFTKHFDFFVVEFLFVFFRTNTCCAREAAAAWTDTA